MGLRPAHANWIRLLRDLSASARSLAEAAGQHAAWEMEHASLILPTPALNSSSASTASGGHGGLPLQHGIPGPSPPGCLYGRRRLQTFSLQKGGYAGLQGGGDRL